MSKVNLIIDQGTTFNTIIELTDENNDFLNVTGYSAAGQIRKHPGSNSAVSFSTALSNGQLVISLSSSQTSNIAAGRYSYDVELTDPTNSRIRVIEGIVTVTPEVTR